MQDRSLCDCFRGAKGSQGHGQQEKTGADRTGQERLGQDRTQQDRTEVGGSGQDSGSAFTSCHNNRRRAFHRGRHHIGHHGT